MVALAYQQLSMSGPFPGGVTQTFVTPDPSPTENTVPPSDRGFLEFENSNAAARTITVLVPASAGLDLFGVVFPDMTYSLAATTGRRRIGPLDARFAQSDGLIHFTIDANAGVTCAALRS